MSVKNGYENGSMDHNMLEYRFKREGYWMKTLLLFK